MIRRDLLIDGRRIEAASAGDLSAKPVLVFLHEGLGCVALWRDVPERLAVMTGLPVFAYSRFGYGQSDPAPMPWPETYMHSEALTCLPRVLDAAGIARAILIGHSDGGSIATIHAGAANDPRVVAPRVVAPRVLAPRVLAPRVEALITIAAHFFVETANLAAIAAIRAEYETGSLRSRLARYHADPDNAFWGWHDAWLNPAFRAFDILAIANTIKIPWLALQGTDDPYGTEAQLNILDRSVQTLLIPNTRHAPHLEATDETLAAIAAFIRDIPP